MTYKGKRTLDLVIAVPLMLATAPVQIIAASAVRLTMGSPVLFRQVRPGMYGRPFTMVKLRTMHPPDARAGRVDDDSRLTPLGRFLRSTSIDELPTLINVIRGEMSMVGPRPLLMEYLDEYTPSQARRHHVRPGVTGLAQVRGRNALDWDDRFSLDIEYVENHNLRRDLAILAHTLIRVLQRHGVSAPGMATMPVYQRNRNLT